MRKLIFTTMFLLLLFPVVIAGGKDAGANSSYDVRVMVDGEPVIFPDQKPFIDRSTGRTYVPLRFVTEKLGAEVDWNSQDKIVVIQKDDKLIKVPVGSSRPLVNGEPVFLDAVVKLVNDRTVVPLRFMSETLRTEVHWNNNTRTVHIETSREPGEVEENTNSKVIVVNADSVNVRSGPGTGFEVIGRVSRGEHLDMLGQAGDWYKVRFGRGNTGWIAGWLTKIEEEKGKDDENHDGNHADNDLPRGEEGEEETGSENTGSVVTGWKIKEDGENIVAYITTSGPVEYNIFTLTGPDRVVIDLKGVKPGDLPEEVNVDHHLVSKLRTGVFNENPFIVRLVFDVKRPVMFSAVKNENNEGAELKLELYIPKLGTHLKGKTIAIDPGHGGRDPGAVGPTGLKEKDVNMDVALLTTRLLEQNGAEVILTRDTDAYVDLYERTRIAGAAGADVFVSIHMNAHPSAGVAGTSTFYRLDSVSGSGVSQEDNRMLARCVHAQLVELLQRRDIGVQQANFAVLRTATMPAVLVEASFISNPEEENLLKKDSYRAKIAEAITRGIAYYFGQKAS